MFPACVKRSSRVGFAGSMAAYSYPTVAYDCTYSPASGVGAPDGLLMSTRCGFDANATDEPRIEPCVAIKSPQSADTPPVDRCSPAESRRACRVQSSRDRG